MITFGLIFKGFDEINEQKKRKNSSQNVKTQVNSLKTMSSLNSPLTKFQYTIEDNCQHCMSREVAVSNLGNFCPEPGK